MFKDLFNTKTTKPDIVMTVAGAVFAVWKAADTINEYKKENTK